MFHIYDDRAAFYNRRDFEENNGIECPRTVDAVNILMLFVTMFQGKILRGKIWPSTLTSFFKWFNNPILKAESMMKEGSAKKFYKLKFICHFLGYYKTSRMHGVTGNGISQSDSLRVKFNILL